MIIYLHLIGFLIGMGVFVADMRDEEITTWEQTWIPFALFFTWPVFIGVALGLMVNKK